MLEMKHTIDSNIEEYRNYIEQLAIEGKKLTFSNRGEQHALIAISTIFKYSKKELLIFAGDLCGKVATNQLYINNIEKFLNKNGHIKILLDSYSDASNFKETNNSLFEIFKYSNFFKPNSIVVKSSKVILKLGENSEQIHFTVGDDAMFRLERDTKTFAATGSFNDIEFCSILKTNFNDIFDNPELSEDIPL
jgi:hypothetical protein